RRSLSASSCAGCNGFKNNQLRNNTAGGSTMNKKLALVLVPVLSACVTVNIYFPAAAVQRAADQIVEETWGEPGSSGAKQQAPGAGSFRSEKRWAFAGFTREAF